jgi:outer membrane usher protein FimD/PapC
MGRDFKDGSVVGETTTFKPGDRVLVAVAKVDGTTDAAKVRFVWTAVSVIPSGSTAEIKDQKIVENTVVLDKNNNLASSKLTQPNDLPVGKYKVEVYLNNQLTNTTEFTVS